MTNYNDKYNKNEDNRENIDIDNGVDDVDIDKIDNENENNDNDDGRRVYTINLSKISKYVLTPLLFLTITSIIIVMIVKSSSDSLSDKPRDIKALSKDFENYKNDTINIKNKIDKLKNKKKKKLKELQKIKNKIEDRLNIDINFENQKLFDFSTLNIKK